MSAAPAPHADRTSPTRPVRGALWQAGVTHRNARLKVLIDGEPAPLCFAAGKGWALCHPEPGLAAVKPSTRAPLGLAYLIDEFRDAVLREGDVRIVPAAGDDDTAW